MGQIISIQQGMNSFTRAQQRFWDILQETENHDLPVRELCKRAGYGSTWPWYKATKDEAFREKLQALGFRVKRLLTIHERLVMVTHDPEAEWEKDRVDLRCFFVEYPKHVGPAHYHLDFSFMNNEQMKTLVKKYFKARLQFWEPLTFHGELRCMKPFLFELGKRHPELPSFADLTRERAEPFLYISCWQDTKGRSHPISSIAKRATAISLKSMFEYMQYHAWDGAPRQVLIYDEDIPKRPKRYPRPIPSAVLEQLQLHIQELPPYAQHLVTILMVAGLRVEDALHLPEGCLEYDAAGDPRLRWFNHKMKREGRPLPVTTEVAQAIEQQQELVKGITDWYGKRYLFRTEEGLYQFYQFCYQLNILAQRLVSPFLIRLDTLFTLRLTDLDIVSGH